MRASKSITGHVTFKLRYNQIYQLKTTLVPKTVLLEDPLCKTVLLEDPLCMVKYKVSAIFCYFFNLFDLFSNYLSNSPNWNLRWWIWVIVKNIFVT